MTPNEYIDPIVQDKLVLDQEGFLSVPDKPGLGFNWDPDGIAALSGGPTISESTL